MNTAITKTTIPNQIRQIRELRHLSRKRFAVLFGYRSTAQICLWETGKKLPSLRNALMLSIVLAVPVEQLFHPLIWELEIKRFKPQS